MSLYSLAKWASLASTPMSFLRHELQALPHHDDVGVVAHIAAGSTQMDDAGGLGALLAVGIDVAHHVVADQLLPGNGDVIVDIVHMGFQLGHHARG